VTPTVIPRAVPGDQDDDQVIAAAIAAGADIVVSGDRHLLSLGVYETVRILSPAEALATITGSPV
jgi:predicted nucleic acid-binding protein